MMSVFVNITRGICLILFTVHLEDGWTCLMGVGRGKGVGHLCGLVWVLFVCTCGVGHFVYTCRVGHCVCTCGWE